MVFVMLTFCPFKEDLNLIFYAKTHKGIPYYDAGVNGLIQIRKKLILTLKILILMLKRSILTLK